MKLSELWSTTTALSVTPVSNVSFGIPALLVDHADVPIYARYRQVTRSSYATDLTASTDQTSWCATLWGQLNYSPSKAYIARWAKAATAAGCVMHSATSVASVYAALTNTAKVKIVEGASSEDVSPDFTGDTSMADVAASIQAAMAAGTIPASYTCEVDALDNIVIWSDNTGASADAVSLASPASGTDLTGVLYLGSSTAIAGLDAEAPETAVAAVLALDDSPYAWCIRSTPSVAQSTSFSTGINALNKFCFLRESDLTAKTSGVADFSYAIEALSHNRTHGSYTEHTVTNGATADQNPDAALCGEILPRLEGSTNYAMTPLTGVSESGLNGAGAVVPLSVSERGFLEGKGCDYIITPSSLTHMRNGLAYGGQEVRVMIARDWFNYWVMFDTYAYMISQNVMTFSDPDIAAVRSIIKHYADVLIDRKCLDAGYTLNMPLASSFTATQKATHTMDLTNVFDADVQIAVNDGSITMSWSV